MTVDDEACFRSALSKQLEVWHAQILESSVTHNQNGTTSYSMVVKMHDSVKHEDIFAFLEQNSNVSSFQQTING